MKPILTSLTGIDRHNTIRELVKGHFDAFNIKQTMRTKGVKHLLGENKHDFKVINEDGSFHIGETKRLSIGQVFRGGQCQSTGKSRGFAILQQPEEEVDIFAVLM